MSVDVGAAAAAALGDATWHDSLVTTLDRVLPSSEPSARWRRGLANVGIAAAPLAVGAVSGALSAPAIRGWYRTLDRPGWNPPDRVFGPVWTALYAAMGGALLTITRAKAPDAARRRALGLFGLQLILNFGWSWIFFVEHAIGLAAAEILALWLAIAGTIVAVGRVSPIAAAVLLPYLGWVTFATALNVAIWRRNRPRPAGSRRVAGPA